MGRKRSQCFSYSIQWICIFIGGSSCARSRTYDLCLTCPVSAADTLTCRVLHVSCMVAPLSSAVLYRRSYFVQFFSTKVERHRAPFCGTHNFCVILPYGADANCVAPR